MPDRLERWGWAALWAALLGVALWARPLLPLDETRYLAVAWEMWVRGDFLVPHLNGEPYSHKPPLLFWLIHLGWAVAGVNAWWPRLVPPLFAVAAAGLTVWMARRLWPGRPAAARAAGWLLSGTFLWAAYATLLFFDPLLAFFATLGVAGLVEGAAGRRRGWVLVALGVGLGLLAKGPAVLAWILPPALLGPWWAGERARRAGWYGAVAAAVVAGVALAGLWALPAATAGGEAYGRAILWGQTAGRVVSAFAHARPWWWYLALLPALLLPWTLWGPAWRAMRSLRPVGDRGLGLCAAWALPGLVIFSLVSGKQPHYLIPMLPPLALALARGLAAAGGRRPRPRGALPLAALLAGLAAGGWAALARSGADAPVWAQGAVAGWLALPAAAGVALALARPGGVWAPALAWAALLAALHLAFAPGLRAAYDVAPAARVLAALERAGRPLAHAGKYHGQFHFAGRLRRPLARVATTALPAWARRHPHGAAIVYYETWAGAGAALQAAEAAGLRPLYAGPFRGDGLVIWPAAVLSTHPDLVLAGAERR